MSEPPLDLKRSMHIVRQHKYLVGTVALVGLLAGAAYAEVKPPMYTSDAVVLLAPSTKNIDTQRVIAGSDAVLAGALPHVNPHMSLAALQDRIEVKHLTSNGLSVVAKGKTEAQAEDTANAVAGSYVAYIGSPENPFGRVSAQFFERATVATHTSLASRLVMSAGPGLLAGLLVGIIIALALGRIDRRLRQRDDVADAIGVPVLASVPVRRPGDAAGWTKLFDDYEPGTVDAWRLRKALHQLGIAGEGRAAGRSSLVVLSLSSDQKALALAPQLAVYAASLGIPTTFVVGSQQDINVAATLRTACAAWAPSERSGQLRVMVSDKDHVEWLPGTTLTVISAVVDDKAPRVADIMRAGTTLLGVSAGVATAEQLARVAASAAADGRDVTGILVADPIAGDPTTGRMPELSRPAQHRMPRRMTGAATEIRK
jgi:capsular polysaccharide biosynthesis protein